MKTFLLHLLVVSIFQGSLTELIIQVNPETISPGLTPKLVVKCNISDEKVSGLSAIESLNVSLYNETRKTFDVLYTIDKETLSLKQIVELKDVQISFGNLSILLTFYNPNQFESQIYRCSANGYTDDGSAHSVSAKKTVASNMNITGYVKEIKRLKEFETDSIIRENIPLKNIEKLIADNINKQVCSSANKEASGNQIETHEEPLQFSVNSKIIKEFFQPMIMKCVFQVSKKEESKNFTVQYMYIRHETNGVLATISSDQHVGISRDTSLSEVQGQLSDQDFNVSYLEIKLPKPNPSQSGKYVCGANVFNHQGKLETLKTSLEITVEKTSLDDLVPIVIDLLAERSEVKQILEANKKEAIEIKQLVRSAGIENVRLINESSAAAFILYSNVEFSGCQSNHTSQTKTLAMNCLSNVECAALRCAKDLTCTPCYRSSISGLWFPDHGTEFYVKRRTVVSSEVEKRISPLVFSESYAVPSGFSAGDLIYIRVTLLKYDNLYIDLVEDFLNTNYQFRARCTLQCSGKGNCLDSECKSRFVTIDSKTNGQWSGTFVSYDYPFVLNKEFEMYLLILQGSVEVYIQDKLYSSFKTSRKPENIRNIQFGGTVVLHEFSF